MTLVANTNLLAARVGQEFVQVRQELTSGLDQVNATVASSIAQIKDADGGAFSSTDMSV
jgi:hypothetical protein